MASALPDGQRQACVQQMLDIVVQPMQGILQAAAAEGGAGSAPGTPTAGGGGAAPPAAAGAQLQLVLPLMERVTTVFRAVKDPADVAEALVRLWPWIEAALGALARCGGAAGGHGWGMLVGGHGWGLLVGRCAAEGQLGSCHPSTWPCLLRPACHCPHPCCAHPPARRPQSALPATRRP